MGKKVRVRLAIPCLAGLATLAMAGCGSGSSASSTNLAATPSFSPGAGTYKSSQTVTISDSTSNAVLYCTTDGTTPTTSSPKCSQPTTVYQTEFLQAIAVAPGAGPSAIASAAYTIDLSAVGAPTFSPAGGSYASAQQVTIADTTSGANIYYTTDGSTPGTSSTLYTGPVTVSASETLSAIAVASGYSNSSIAMAAYTIGASLAAPAFSLPSGNYTVAQTVTISDATANAAIYYTTDGSTPTASSTAYTGPISVAQTEVVSAIAILAGSSSPVSVAAYEIGQTSLNQSIAEPSFSLAAGTYATAQTVAISDATANAAIYYTLDGSTPTASSTAYTGPIQVAQTETISAVAVLTTATGTAISPENSATYTISQPVAAPVFSVPTGNYTSAQTVTITDATPSATIYYAINNTAPTTASTPYTAAIVVAQTETLSAIAVLGTNTSAIATVAYTVGTSVAPPTFTPAAGSTVGVGQTLTLADGDAKAILYYTTNGDTPTAASTKYTAPIPFSTVGAVTFDVVAIDGAISSPVAIATYTVKKAPPAPVFTPASGASLTAGQSVTLADTDANAVLYYTTDGSTPTAASTKYSAPIALSTPGPETIEAIAIDSGVSSPVATASYTVTAVGPALSGTVLSGTSPVKGAEVQLYAAGQSGYGSNATALGAPVATSSTGAFTLSFTCPASPGDLLYLVATGGDSGHGPNSSLDLMTALGPCAKIAAGASFTINEVTTVASAYALSAFMTAAPNAGSSATNYQGLKNSFATVSNLVNVATGAALSITPAYAASPVAALNSSTVPKARIDTLADMLNACTSTDGSGCAGLFSAATPAAGSPPDNTLQAILDIAQNPGAKASALFAVASPTGPFQPELAAAPGDWTLALTFTGAGLGIAPNTTASYTSGGNPETSTLAIINTSLAIDAGGNIWVTAYADNNPTNPIISSDSVDTLVAEFNGLGAPVTPATKLSSASTPVVTFGGFDPDQADPAAALSAGAIDEAGNLWFPEIDDSGGALVETSPQLSVLLAPFGPGQPANFVAIDASNNIWAAFTSINEFKSDGTPVTLSPPSSESTPSAPSDLVFDSNGNLWAAAADDVVELDANAGIVFDAFPGSSGALTTLAADGAGNIYGCGDAGGQTLDVFNSGAKVHSYPIASGRGCGNQLLLDGQGRLFAITDEAGAPPIGNQVDEFTAAGVAISPASGYTGTSAGEAPTLNPDPNYFSAVPGASAAIDPSGNLWVLNNDTNGASAAGNVLVEFVGIAAPVSTPLSVALKNGQLGLRP